MASPRRLGSRGRLTSMKARSKLSPQWGHGRVAVEVLAVKDIERNRALTSMGPRLNGAEKRRRITLSCLIGKDRIRPAFKFPLLASGPAMENLDEILTHAYTELNASRPSSTEDITCDPSYRQPFLQLVHTKIPDLPEAEALRRLSYLRKRSRLPCLRRNRPTSN